MMPKIYIAGPFRGPNAWAIENNIREAEYAGLEVAKIGLCPVIPHSMFRFFQGTLPDSFWLEATTELLRPCQGILMLPKWRQSAGSRAELGFALENKIEPFYISGPSFIQELQDWFEK